MNNEEQWYRSKPDPWGYQTNRCDIFRKAKLLAVSYRFGPYKRCLDIGAGEGWITADYPADEIYGYEFSDTAAARFPANVKRVIEPEGKYDLITCTGIFYAHYDWYPLMQLVLNHASKHVIVSSIKQWEITEVNDIGRELHYEEFPYREFDQRLRVFQV